MVFASVAVACLSQDIVYIAKRMRAVPKVEIVQSAAKPSTRQNIDQLFIDFILK